MKNNIEHFVPLSAVAVGILKDLPRIRSKCDFVFTTTGVAPLSGFARAKISFLTSKL